MDSPTPGEPALTPSEKPVGARRAVPLRGGEFLRFGECCIPRFSRLKPRGIVGMFFWDILGFRLAWGGVARRNPGTSGENPRRAMRV
jgi:hypothetical protein